MENREIKFRAWDEYQKKMLDWTDITDPMKLTLSNLLNGLIEHLKPMQYTGLKDKKGKEIYGGDWLLDNVSRKWVIKYEPKKAAFLFYYKGISHPQPFSRFNKYQKPLEIIGNIYKNPELIKQLNEA